MREDVIFFSKPLHELPFYLDLVGISYCDGNYKMSRADSRTTVLEYIVSGTGTLTVNEKNYTPKRGDVYLLRQGTRHHYHSSAEDPWVKIFFNIQGSLAETILDEYQWGETVLIKNANMEQEFRAMLERTSDPTRTRAEIYDRMTVDFLETVIKLRR